MKKNCPTIYINGRFLTAPMTGVERFAYTVCKTMSKLGHPFTIVCPHGQIQSCYDISDLPLTFYGYTNSHFWEQCILPFFFLGKKNYLVFSFTGLGSILIRPKVMTIHDLSFLENPDWFSRAYYWWYKIMTPIAARTSRYILTVSEFSKSEILRFYPFLNGNRIHVVYAAADESHFHVIENVPNPTERFALAVSSFDPRKNFPMLIEAFKDLEDCKLYIVGSKNRVFTEQTALEQTSHIKFLGRVSDNELLTLYNQASCFIFPSIYEGFGLPPIEAMHCGCPVLASDIPVLREICGDAAFYFDPTKAESIKNVIKQYFQQLATLKPALRKSGFANAKRFNWEATVSRILQLSEQIEA